MVFLYLILCHLAVPQTQSEISEIITPKLTENILLGKDIGDFLKDLSTSEVNKDFTESKDENSKGIPKSEAILCGTTTTPISQPSGQPTDQPSGQPTDQPSGYPTDLPSGEPSGHPSGLPSGFPTGNLLSFYHAPITSTHLILTISI